MSFFHGVKNISLPATGGTIEVVPSAVIGIVGVSPYGPVQALTLCNNAADDAQFGPATPDNNIAKTLNIIRNTLQGASTTGSDGSCAIFVVNVYASGTHKVAIGSSGTNKTPDAVTGKLALNMTLIAATLDLVQIKLHSDSSGVNVAAGGAYVYGTDYTLDAYGNFVDITGTYLGVALDFVGYKLDASTVTGAAIIGGTSGATKTGIAMFDLCMGTYGFVPKLLVTPTYATLSGVAAAMEAAAGKFNGEWLSDSASGVSVTSALALRGSGQWNTSKPQTRPLWPWLKSYDAFTNSNVIYPYSAYLAGMYVANDKNVGYWQSVSNQQIPTVVDVETYISTGFTDDSSQANQLNAAGIMTYLTGYGLGFKTWGNRNASFPASSSVLTFSNVYRTDGLVKDSMTQAALPYVDKPISDVLIDIVKTAGNNFLKVLIQQGALLPGSAISYNKADNTPSNLAAGIIAFRRNYMVPTPAEQLTFYDILDISLFGNLG